MTPAVNFIKGLLGSTNTLPLVYFTRLVVDEVVGVVPVCKVFEALGLGGRLFGALAGLPPT